MSPHQLYSAARSDHQLNVTKTTHNMPPVVAAGCIIWRQKKDKIEVLIIHRPHYDDWSWPKGKQDHGETVAETAVREVREEVGLTVTLGAPLAVTRYSVKHGKKEVFYWAARASSSDHAQADLSEVDELRWVSPAEARKLLTNDTDQEPLDALIALHERGHLHTRPVIIVRHAKAKPRSSWAGAEGERTLVATGKRQALAVGELLQVWAPTRIISSPWTRCMQTVAPYSKATGLVIKQKSALTEAAYKAHPKKVAKIIQGLFDKDDSVMLCTHRPVLPTVLEVLTGVMDAGLAKNLPAADPYLTPGEMLVMQVSVGAQAEIVSLEQIKPFSD
ncbi:NUDIX domain-containing protein [Rothia sp. ZJ1223]|uniref:NUDIX hydrolase n=1 Tax=Rothia sp. ZJ1223 TaxID=2811098 RepID=UPI00195EDE3C|nr:NUDIX domain-containing protein [Rothia sp. ZJ1223]MBM7051886.1 NUDIX hydrolase [Rothia sp. ZJ1223]